MNYDILIIEPVKEMMAKVFNFIPPLLIALGILIGGYLIAQLIKKVFMEILKFIQFDKLITRVGLTRVLEKGDITCKPSKLMCNLVYTIMMVITLIMAVKSIGLLMVSSMLDTLLAYVPSVISGVLVLIIGMLLAKFVSNLVYITAKNTDMPRPELLSRLSKFAILVYVAILYLKEIGFVALFVGVNYTIFIGGIVFALALSFGLAGRSIASKYLEVFNVRKTSH